MLREKARFHCLLILIGFSLGFAFTHAPLAESRDLEIVDMKLVALDNYPSFMNYTAYPCERSFSRHRSDLFITPGSRVLGCIRTQAHGHGNNKATVISEIPGCDDCQYYEQDYILETLPGEEGQIWQIPFRLPLNVGADGERRLFRFTISAPGDDFSEIKREKSIDFFLNRRALINLTRAFQWELSMDPSLLFCKFSFGRYAQGILEGSPLKYETHLVPFSLSAKSFVERISIYQPLVTLVDAKFMAYPRRGVLQFLDDVWFDSLYIESIPSPENNFRVPGGLFFAAMGYSQVGSYWPGLAAALVNSTHQFNAFICYNSSLYGGSLNNELFYTKFFEMATVPNVSVTDALNKAKRWALDKEMEDVATAEIWKGTGTEEIYLGGKTGASGAAPQETVEKISVPYDPWREVGASGFLPTPEEDDAVKKAGKVEAVRKLKKKYGGALKTGIEGFRSTIRVGYKVNNKFLYGVDIDRTTGEAVRQGELN